MAIADIMENEHALNKQELKELAGDGLSYFLNNTDCSESHIGEFKTIRIDDEKETVMVVGMAYNKGSPIKIMKAVSSIQKNNLEFNKYMETSARQLLEFVRNNRNSAEISNAKQRLDDIIDNKLVFTVLKPGMEINIQKGNRKLENVKIETVVYSYNPEKETFEYRWETEQVQEGIGQKVFKFSNDMYGSQFVLTAYSEQSEQNKKNSECIEMSASGMVKPITISDNKHEILVGNKYVLCKDIKNNTIEVAGTWQNGEFVPVEWAGKFKEPYKTFLKAAPYIANYIRFMPPHGIIDSKKVEA